MRGAGLRISECLAVRLDGFRDGGSILRVHEQVSRDGGYGPLKARKVNEYRDIPVPSWLWSKVQAHVDRFEAHGGYLFKTDYHTFNRRFKKSVGQSGLPAKFTEHHLRHLFVSTLLAAGVPITDAAA